MPARKTSAPTSPPKARGKPYRSFPLRTVKVVELKPYPSNPRVPIREDPSFYKSLDGSMDAFGYVVPIVWNERSGHVVSGNQRLQLIKDAGMGEVEVVVVDYDDNTERAAVVALNNIGGRFVKDGLAELLAQIEGEMRKRTGFSDDELKRLLRSLRQRSRDPDDVPDAPEAIAKRGDTIILGDHKLMCGDSTNAKGEVDRLLRGETATMVFTDPPYNCDLGSTLAPDKQSRTRAKVTGKSNAAIANDNLDAEAWKAFCAAVYAVYKRYCPGDIYQWGAAGPEGMRSRIWLAEAGCHWSTTIVWAKDSIVLSPANYHRQYEPCFYGWFGRSTFNNKLNDGGERSGLSDLWTCAKPSRSDLHPTMKPVEICEKGILNSSKEGDAVLDLFGGSGSTMIACERTARRCLMMELEPHYCDVIVRRWEDFTGETAVRA